MVEKNEVLFEEIIGSDANIGVITLNRPSVLNSINLNMIHAMHEQLKKWENADTIKAVVIRAVPGRAFCVGGDLKAIYEYQNGDNPAARFFFRDEYELNKCIFHYAKPYIAFLDGITMGGGVGISIHSSHRVGTEQLVFAMPETGIGFFPDIGGTYFLPRLAGRIGYYLGLTGARINCDDCKAIGVIQHKVLPTSLASLLESLASTPFGEDPRQSVSDIIDQYALPTIPSSLLGQQAILDQVFSNRTMEDIIQSLQQSTTAECQAILELLKKKSPTSLKITLKALQEGEHLDFDACMNQEYHLATRFNEEHDFNEGIRAVLIDKDQTPHWKPSTLASVTPEIVNSYFSPAPIPPFSKQ